MRTIETTLYQYDELPTEEAKEKAREWWQRHVFEDEADWEFIFDDAQRAAEILGIEIDTRRGSSQPAIYFSGFWSQGDGACFEGNYYYNTGAAKKIKDFAPQDAELHQIARDLQEIQRRHFYQLRARVEHSGRYSHEYSTTITVEKDGYDAPADAEDGISEALRDFMCWIYKRLESEYEYQSSDEATEEAIRANGYEFTADGELA